MTMQYAIWMIALTLFLSHTVLAHDSWVQTNSHVVRVRDTVHVDLMLGNHGNHHRDYRLVGKVALDDATLSVTHHNGTAHDLKPSLIDTASKPAEGYWTARFRPAEPGVYMVSHTYDRVVHYAPLRSVKSAKTFFVASSHMDDVPEFEMTFAPLGHALELVPLTHPVTPMQPGRPIRVQLLFDGQPLAEHRVSFIPRSQTLSETFDERYERMTDSRGIAEFVPMEDDYHLIVAHHEGADASGEGYIATKYSATLAVYVPGVCACCEGKEKDAAP